MNKKHANSCFIFVCATFFSQIIKKKVSVCVSDNKTTFATGSFIARPDKRTT